MKKVLLVAALVLGTIALQAQVYLTDVLKPSEEHRIKTTTSKADTKSYDAMRIAHIYHVNATLVLNGAAHGLVGSDDHAYATYKLNGAYSKLTFWLGPTYRAGGVGSKSLLTITADGKRVFDQPVFNYDPPRFITIDVKGVNEIKFKVLVGELDIALAYAQLWKEGVAVVQPKLPVTYPQGKIKLVEQLMPYYTTGYINPIQPKDKAPNSLEEYPNVEESISMSRHEFKSGLQFTSDQKLIGNPSYYSYFWLGKRYEKLSFIVGPRDNQSSNSSAWLVVYGDKKKILYEGIVTQKDLPKQVVVDVSGQESVGFSCELRSSDFLGSITFGAVDIYAYPKSDLASVPKEGPANINKETVAKIKSPASLMTNIQPYSVRGVAKAKNTMFTGESSYITFSMGGEKFSEGIILASGATLFDDNIDAYATFDLAGEFDYISFYSGMLTNRRVLEDDRLRVYADDKIVLDTVIHCTWPNQYFEVPIYKCRSLRFAKPGNKKQKQCFIGVGDIALYRGKPVKNDLFYHEKPECPPEADLIDLCTRPYFHYVGRYLSTLTNFDFNDCFIPGGSQRSFFQMKDGSKIYKGVMLEANLPLALEDITLTDAVMMFFVGAGSALGSSDVSAYTGVSAGGGITGQWAITRLMNSQNGGQASVVAFNPFGEYESCTFTVANKSEYWDDVDKLKNFGERVDHPFKLNIFADQRLVGEVWLTNKMEPQTITVPIFKCHSLMFWLESGPARSGQFVLYDMKVSKKPCSIQPPTKISTNAAAAVVEQAPKAESAKVEAPAKQAEHAKVETPAKPAEPAKVETPSQPTAPKEQPKEQPQQPAQTNKQQTTNKPAANQIVIPKGNNVNQSKSGNSLMQKK